MAQYKKLFDKSEIEYITPFLKLWMSFNNWYKSDIPGIRTDREAIDSYKQQGQIKTEFIRLLNGRSNEDVKFQDFLSRFVKNVDECEFESFEYPADLFIKNPSERVIQNQSLVFISPNNKEFYFTSGDEGRFFESTLELIYQIRCKLVHGDFDIDDQLFIDFVENCYRILYPIMNKILQESEIKLFYCQNKKGTYAKGQLLSDGKMVVLKDSRICKLVTDSYYNAVERSKLINTSTTEDHISFILVKTLEFQSPSAASSFCLGKSSNGWVDWKDKNKKTMSEIIRNSSI